MNDAEFEKKLSASRSVKGVPFNTKIGFDLSSVNRYLGVVGVQRYSIIEALGVVFDVSKISGQGQFSVTTMPFDLEDTATNIDVAAPKDQDHIYGLLSLSLPVARAIKAQVIKTNTDDGPYVLSNSSTATLHIFSKTTLPLIVPAGHFLRIIVVSSAAADGTATLGYQRLTKETGLGFSYL
jgi:hypothetical protein